MFSMSGLLFSLFLLAQAQLGNGVVTGVLRDATGKPVEKARVALAEVSDTGNPANPASVLVSIATTDSSGGYRLDNVPPGRYYIVAGRVDSPTYYPGVQKLALRSGIRLSLNVAPPPLAWSSA